MPVPMRPLVLIAAAAFLFAAAMMVSWAVVSAQSGEVPACPGIDLSGYALTSHTHAPGGIPSHSHRGKYADPYHAHDTFPEHSHAAPAPATLTFTGTGNGDAWGDYLPAASYTVTLETGPRPRTGGVSATVYTVGAWDTVKSAPLFRDSRGATMFSDTVAVHDGPEPLWPARGDGNVGAGPYHFRVYAPAGLSWTLTVTPAD